MTQFQYAKDTVFELRQNIIDAADEAVENEQWIALNNLFDALETVTDLYINITRTEYEQKIKDLEKELKGVSNNDRDINCTQEHHEIR